MGIRMDKPIAQGDRGKLFNIMAVISGVGLVSFPLVLIIYYDFWLNLKNKPHAWLELAVLIMLGIPLLIGVWPYFRELQKCYFRIQICTDPLNHRTPYPAPKT